MPSQEWYDELPEFITEAHNRIARRLANALESARSPADPCLTVDTDVDVVLWRVPRFTFRRPGVIVYRCIDDPARKPTAQEDLLDKKAQYAAAGIPVYLVIVLGEKHDIADIREFHLDAATAACRLHAVHWSVLDLEQPVRLALPIVNLVAA